MAEMTSVHERVREGENALARGAWDEAREIFEQEVAARETVEALEGLSWAAWWVEDVPACLEARERAYLLSREQGDMRRAAMLAICLADDHLVLRGERAIANGWFQRAARTLEGLELCPEHGWLDALLGYMAIIEGDQARARELAVRARTLGRRFTVVSLEMFALSVEGVALVGIDSLNIDDTGDPARPVHSALLGAEVPIVEHMCNLSRLPERDFRFFAVPAKVAGFGSWPVRAFGHVLPPNHGLRVSRRRASIG
jgi:hypothetical protein